MPVATSPSVGRGIAAKRAATEGQSATLTRSKAETLSGSSATAAVLPRLIGAVRAPTSATAPVLVRQTVKPMLLTVVTAASNASGHVFSLVLSTIAHAGKNLQSAALSAASATTATIAATKVVNRTYTATQSQAAALAHATGKTLYTLTQMALPPISASLNAVASLSIGSRVTSQLLAAAETTAATALKTPARAFAAASGSLASLASQKVAHLATLTASAATTATRILSANRILAPAATTVATASRAMQTGLKAATATAAHLGPFLTSRTLQAATATVATARRGLTRTLIAAPATVALLLRATTGASHAPSTIRTRTSPHRGRTSSHGDTGRTSSKLGDDDG